MNPDDRTAIDPEEIPEPAQANAQTFLKMGRTLPDELTDEADVAVVGVPFDGGVYRQPGTRFGPVAIREASAGFYASFYNRWGAFINASTGRELDWDDIEVRDCGDIATLPSRLDLAEPVIRDGVRTVAEQATPVILGGDHSITYPAFMGYAEAVDETVGIVHLDAHADMGGEIAGTHHHGSMFPRIHDSSYGDSENHAIIGIRGYMRPDFPAEVKDRGMHVSYYHDVREKGIEAVTEEAIAHATDGVDHVYLTVDIDVLDPAYAPGSGSPRPRGLSSDELLRAIDILGACDAVGAMDLVEVNPQLDPTTTTWKGNTQQIAVEAVLGFIEATVE